MKKLTLKSFGLLALTASLGTGQALAHTGVKDQVDEGKASYNGFTITHGCAAGEKGSPNQSYPVLGQTALFPFGATAVWRNAKGEVISTGGQGIIKDNALSLSVTGYAGMSSPFTTAQEIVDADGVVRALHWRDGAMEPMLNAVTPFKITAPTITDPCVKSLKVRIGVINWCDIAKNEENDAKGPYKAPKDAFKRKIPITSINNGTQVNAGTAGYFSNMSKGNGDNNRADWWFKKPEGGSALYQDPDILQPSYWTTLTVNNPDYDQSCGADVSVEPSGVDFDTYLTGANTQPFTKGSGPF